MREILYLDVENKFNSSTEDDMRLMCAKESPSQEVKIEIKTRGGKK